MPRRTDWHLRDTVCTECGNGYAEDGPFVHEWDDEEGLTWCGRCGCVELLTVAEYEAFLGEDAQPA